MGFAIGVDVGSQSVKGVLLDDGGRVCAEAGSPVSIVHPAPAWAEQDPRSWETGLAAVVGALLSDAHVKPDQVSALALACQVDSVVPVDAAGDPLGAAIIWLDRRAEVQAAELRDRVGAERLHQITGLVADPSHTGPKIAWLRSERPEVFAAAAAFPPTAGYLVQRLTGELVIDHANASSSLLYDLGRRAWSAELLAAVGVSAEQLGRIGESDEVAGALTADAARRLGLTTACQVVVGTGDDHAGAVGAGVVRPGLVADITGTAEPVSTCSPLPVLDVEALVETHAHAVPGQYLIENPGFVSGGSIMWLAREVLQLTQAEALALAETEPAGAGGVRFVPALSGSMAPRWNGAMRGVFAGLSMTTSRAALARAVVEGCCFALRDITDRFATLGLDTTEIRVVGGGARSREWLQIKADVTGRPVRAVQTTEATALGAGLLATVACGTFTDLDEAVKTCVVTADEPIRPRAVNEDVYAEAYASYRRLFDGVEGALG
ncbi:MAG: xylulokinase [Pseudonocardiales bacterium]|nr:xylulokinase [Pseudonocardiales bacterium]